MRLKTYNFIYFRYISISMVESESKQTDAVILHSPNLVTIMMVENTLKEAGEVLTVAELKRRLPRKVMHQTILQILDYLQGSGKILIGTKGVLWIFTEKKDIDRLIKSGIEL